MDRSQKDQALADHTTVSHTCSGSMVGEKGKSGENKNKDGEVLRIK